MNKNEMSKNAKKIYNLLNKCEVKIKLEYTFDDLFGLGGGLLRFDFALLDSDNNLLGLIEYDGEYHDEELNPDEYDYFVLSTHDKLKNSYCKKRAIPLLRIHHTEIENYNKLIMSFLKSINVKIDMLKLTSSKLIDRKNRLLELIKSCDEDDENLDDLLQELNEVMYELKDVKSIWKGGKTHYVKSYVKEVNNLVENTELKMEELGVLLYIATTFTGYEDNYLRLNKEFLSKADVINYLHEKTKHKPNSSVSQYKRIINKLEKHECILSEQNEENKRRNILYLNPKIFYKGRYIDKGIKEFLE